MLSAHPISRLSESQPGSRHQARHLPATVIAMPKEVQASEKAAKSRDAGVCGMGRWVGFSNAWSHQSKSLVVSHGCVRGIKGLSPNIPNMACRDMRYALPSGITNAA